MIIYDDAIGTFNITSNALRISDPCYEPNSSGGVTINNVVNGSWLAYYKSNADTITHLIAIHNLYRFEASVDHFYAFATIGVDSGQAGIFDNLFYETNQGGEYDELDTFYGKCCQATLNDAIGIIDSNGVVSCSGYGDGQYDVYIMTNDNHQVIAIMIEFISETNQDDDDDYIYFDNNDDAYYAN